MNRPPWQSLLIKKLAGSLQAGNSSPKRIVLLALGLIGLLYTILLIALNRPTANPQITADTFTAPRQEVSLSTSTAGADPGADDELGAAFLSEYERLSGGQPTADEANVVPSASATTGSWASTLIFSLLAVLGLAYVGIWGFKQFTLRANGGAPGLGGQRLSIQETQVLGPHQKLHLVRLGQEMLLIGATDQSITCLARYDADHLDDNFDQHLEDALHPQSPANQPVSLQESLEALRQVQHRGRGGDHA